MLKRTLFTVGLSCLSLIAIVMSFSGCDILNDIIGSSGESSTTAYVKHTEHEFGEEWSHDDTHHWFSCIYAGCPERDRYHEHNLENRLCTVCGYLEPRIVNSVNHRGHILAPENTLSAFRLSHEMGFNAVECDVNFTADGVPVLLHDETIDRTSNGTGNIGSLTFEQVRQYDFGSWKSTEYVGEKIPSFEEFLQLCEELKLHAYIELKEDMSDAQIALISSLIDKYDVEHTWISFHTGSLQGIMALRPDDRYGLLVGSCSTSAVDTVKGWIDDGYDSFLDCNYSSLADENIQYCIDNNVPLEIWTINDKFLLLLMHEYISGFTSDKVNANAILNDSDNFN